MYSGSADRSIKVWDAGELAYVDTLFGHQAGVTAMAALSRERVFTSGADRTVRLWKVGEQTQLIFRAPATDLATDAVAAINDAWFASGGADGALSLWHVSKKHPVYTRQAAHAVPPPADDGGGIHAAPQLTHWVTALAHCPGSDVLASGSGDGFLRLWRLVSEQELAPPGRGGVSDDDEDDEDEGGGGGGGGGGEAGAGAACSADDRRRARRLLRITLSTTEAVRATAFRGIVALGSPIPVAGVINGIAFSADGRLLVAAVGHEHRLGAWYKNRAARDGVLFVRLPALPARRA